MPVCYLNKWQQIWVSVMPGGGLKWAAWQKITQKLGVTKTLSLPPVDKIANMLKFKRFKKYLQRNNEFFGFSGVIVKGLNGNKLKQNSMTTLFG